MKRLCIVFLIIVLVLSMSSFAYSTQALSAARVNLIEIAENMLQISMMDQVVTNSSQNQEFYLCKPIPAYEVNTSNALVSSNVSYYPIVSGTTACGVMIAFADDNGQLRYEFTDTLNSLLEAMILNNTKLCLISDQSSFWTYGENTLTKLMDYDLTELELGNIALANISNIKTTGIVADALLNASNTRDASVSNILDVPVVTQATGSEYCWACCAVSTGQYKDPSIIYSAEEIAMEYTGDLYTSAPMSTIKEVLFDKYFRGNITILSNLTYTTVQTHINNDRPMIARVEYASGGGHVFVVRGYHIPGDGTSYLAVMDPLSGYRLLSQTSNGNSSTVLYYWNPNRTNTYQILNSIAVR